ncbi:MAG: DUF2721 domain-containing protein [Thermoanaerobaculia bacterium]|nr:DUF2721 domain-containing protein [Thermoanaerobaculia bacterium]
MHAPSLDELIPVLQVAIGPVILISGIGLLLLSMTNRYGRTIDRARQLSRLRETADVGSRARIAAQIAIITRRAHLIRRSIFLAATSVLFAAILIIVLFVSALLRVDVAWAIALMFIACMASFIGALVTFIQDVNQSLVALMLELGE